MAEPTGDPYRNEPPRRGAASASSTVPTVRSKLGLPRDLCPRFLFVSNDAATSSPLAVRSREEKELNQLCIDWNWAWRSIPHCKLDELAKAVESFKPHIIHFAAHGEELSGIILADGTVNAAQLAEKVFKTHKPLLVFMNCCETSSIGESLRNTPIEASVSWRSKVKDSPAINFANNFYAQLYSRRNYLDTFNALNDPAAAIHIADEVDPLAQFLTENGLGDYAKKFKSENIEWQTAQKLTVEELRELGLSLGHRKTYLERMQQWKDSQTPQPHTSLPVVLSSAVEGAMQPAKPTALSPAEPPARTWNQARPRLRTYFGGRETNIQIRELWHAKYQSWEWAIAESTHLIEYFDARTGRRAQFIKLLNDNKFNPPGVDLQSLYQEAGGKLPL